MKKILIVFGTRPEAIKMAPLFKEFQKYPEKYNTKVCVTAQHRELLDQVLDIFEIKPDYDLNIMRAGQDLYDITSKVLLGIRDVLIDFAPNFVLVHGDTTTSTATALAAFYQQIAVGHVEAGLRTNNIYSPWPEEMNRQITTRLSTLHFAPTETSKQNLIIEGVDKQKIFITGNTVIDALFQALEKIKTNSQIENSICEQIIFSGYPNLIKLKSNIRKSILITGHRRENFGDGFINICNAIKSLAISNPDFDLIYPVHLNPNVQKPVIEILDSLTNVYLIRPLEYLPFIYLMKHCYLVLTDSGGIQEEAPSLGKPVIVMRETTERSEALAAGTVKLVGVNKDLIYTEVQKLIDDQLEYNKMVNFTNPYGDGKAAQKIVKQFE